MLSAEERKGFDELIEVANRNLSLPITDERFRKAQQIFLAVAAHLKSVEEENARLKDVFIPPRNMKLKDIAAFAMFRRERIDEIKKREEKMPHLIPGYTSEVALQTEWAAWPTTRRKWFIRAHEAVLAIAAALRSGAE